MKKKMIVVLAIATTLLSCDNGSVKDNIIDFVEDVNLSSNGVKGTYYQVEKGKTKKNDPFTILKVGLISELTFKGSYCKFQYFGMTVNGKYEVEDGFIYIDTKNDMGILSMEIIDENTLVGKGIVGGTFRKGKKHISVEDEAEERIKEAAAKANRNKISEVERAIAEKEAEKMVNEMFKELEEE